MQSRFSALVGSLLRPRPAPSPEELELLVHRRPVRRVDDLDVLWHRLPVCHPHRAGIGAFGHPIR